MEQFQIEEPSPQSQIPPSPPPKSLPSSFSSFSKWIPLICLAVMGGVLITVLVIHNKQTTVPKKTTTESSNIQADGLSSPSFSSSAVASSRQPRSNPGHGQYHPNSQPIIIAPIDPEAVQQELDGLREAIDDLRLNASRLEAELTALKNANLPSTTSKPDTSEPDRLKAVQTLIITTWTQLWERNEEKSFTPLEALSALTTLELLPPSTRGRKPAKKQAEMTRRWLSENFDLKQIINFPQTETVSTFFTSYIGGLLSAYTITKDESLLRKAVKMADLLSSDAYHPATGVPYQWYTFANRSASGSSSTLSAVGGHHLEAVYLSALRKKPSYLELSQKAFETIKEALPEKKPLYNRLLSIDGLFAEYKVYTLFEDTKDFFYDLLKAFIQSGGADERFLEQYFQALEAVETIGLFTKSNSSENLTWVREFDASLGQYSAWMAPSGCYLGGMFALTADVLKSRDLGNLSNASIRHPNRLLELAKEITQTCTLAANRTSTGLLPERPFFPSQDYRAEGNGFNLNPDLLESYLILWRTTGNEKYRDLAWKQAQALEKVFWGIGTKSTEEKGSFENSGSEQSPSQPQLPSPSPIFLSATLKYLYLIFSDSSFYPLNRWLFNAVGHMLPICGQHELWSLGC